MAIKPQAKALLCCAALVAFVFNMTNRAEAFSFIFAGEANGLDIVAHPEGYNGVGGVLNVTVGIDASSQANSSSNTLLMAVSVQNVINTFNRLTPTTGNFISDFVNIPNGAYDFESVLLHEMGHSLGLAHTNIAGGGANSDYSNSSAGPDTSFNFSPGVDGVIGTRDDVRGDDVNLSYFRTSGTSAEVNNPFTIASVVDSTTYSRDLADLPAGDLYAGNASRQNAGTFASVSNQTEAVMNQGTFNNEIQRELGHDDVAGLLYAQSGLDSIAGTADDYTLNLVFAGNVATNGADIVIDFDNGQTGFAVSQSSGTFLSADDIAISSNNIYFNDGFNWHYNQVSNAVAVPEPSATLIAIVGLIAVVRRRKRNS
ncbi:hypothetical protein N9N28_07810 [Rubripirellula amarantea]|nr:hypothetical protein [Rubripirellula amarantea]